MDDMGHNSWGADGCQLLFFQIHAISLEFTLNLDYVYRNYIPIDNFLVSTSPS